MATTQNQKTDAALSGGTAVVAYEAPSITSLGTLAELTLTKHSSGLDMHSTST